MEYRQLTLDDWINIKENLRKQLQDVSEAFVRIGYRLKQIKEQRLYERDGYKDLASFAKEEYGLSATTVSRFMAINTKYSLGGNSELLRPEYVGIGSSKLGEMLTIKDEDMEMIGPATTRESIREIKRFEKEEKKAEGNTAAVASDRESVMLTITEEFFRNQKDLLNDICSDGETAPIEELVNPSGNRTFRTGIYFVSFFDSDKGIKVRTFGQSKPETYTWEEFEYAIDNLFEFCGNDTWANHYRTEIDSQTDKADSDSGDVPESSAEKETENDDINENIKEGAATDENESRRDAGHDERSGQHVPEDLNDTAGIGDEDNKADITGSGKTEDLESVEETGVFPKSAEPEAVPEEDESEVYDHTDNEPEEISPEDTEVVGEEIAPAQKYGLNSGVAEDSGSSEKTMVTRKKYMESMSELKMAEYLYSHLSTTTLKNLSELTKWLLDRVEV